MRRWVWAGRLAATRSGHRLLLARSDVIALAGTSGDSTGTTARSLRDWAEGRDALSSRGQAGGTASDVVLDDRAGRDARAGG